MRIVCSKPPPHHPRQGARGCASRSYLIARSHLLIEDVPGVGRPRSHALARLMGLQFQRIQFSATCCPRTSSGLHLRPQHRRLPASTPGRCSPNLLADEINRATPKTQSALLEAMEERQVTADGGPARCPEPFFVIAAQNPAHQIGTFPLPESQLDRFLLRIRLGYPDPQAERALLMGEDRRGLLERQPAVIGPGRTARHAAGGATRMSPRPPSPTSRPCSPQPATVAEPAGGLSPGVPVSAASPWRVHGHCSTAATTLPEDVQTLFPARRRAPPALAGDLPPGDGGDAGGGCCRPSPGLMGARTAASLRYAVAATPASAGCSSIGAPEPA